MAYNDFTLDMLKQQFALRTDEQGDYFAQVAPVTISERLRDHLQQYVPLALAIGTEKRGPNCSLCQSSSKRTGNSIIALASSLG
jgi:hypothetical protein